jgi:hypothetical protein
VDWLVQNWGARSREEAVQLGQRLRAEGVFEHVKDITKPFLVPSSTTHRKGGGSLLLLLQRDDGCGGCVWCVVCGM